MAKVESMGLDLVEIMMDIEERFGVRLPDDGVGRCRTVADLAGLTTTMLERQKAAHPPTSPVQPLPEVLSERIDPEVLEVVRGIVARAVPAPVERVLAEARLREDLGLD